MNKKSSFYMGNEFNAHGKTIYLDGTKHNFYTPLPQDDVKLMPDFKLSIPKAIGALPLLMNPTNQTSAVLLKGIGVLPNISKVIVTMNPVTGQYTFNYYMSKMGVTDGSFLTKSDSFGLDWLSHLETGGWSRETDAGWQYYSRKTGRLVESGWVEDNGKTYYIKDKYMVSGWQKIEDKWFYFRVDIDQDGVEHGGDMKTGWQELYNKWYYLNNSMKTGWLKIGKKKYYLEPETDDCRNGYMVTGWKEIDNEWYYFKSNIVDGHERAGQMVTGWLTINEKKYYFRSSGRMETGWSTIDGKCYYFEASGGMVTGWQEIEGEKYFFYDDGRMAKSILLIDENGISWWADNNGVCSEKEIEEYTLDQVKNTRNRNKIKTLQPDIQPYIIGFIMEAEILYPDIVITDAFRSVEEQNALYEKGRTKPGKIVTNAKGGSSYHNYGLAIDVVRIHDNIADYENTDYKKLADIAYNHDLEWGGDWVTIKDRPHFQKTFGYSVKELYQKYLNKDFIKGGGLVRI